MHDHLAHQGDYESRAAFCCHASRLALAATPHLCLMAINIASIVTHRPLNRDLEPIEAMDEILNGLNAAQRSVVTSPASTLQILAPPGSGKTKTLTSRVAYLLSHYKYQPWDIICLTFTIKSAKEMRERIAKLIGNGIEMKIVLGTFHSVCRRYLVRYGHLIELGKGFGIADSSDTIAIINRIVKRLKLNIDAKTARARISNAKARNLDLRSASTKQKSVDQQEFLKVYEAYESHLRVSNLLDYDDLLLRCIDLLKGHPACVSNVQATLIDEFQDTSVVQFELMQLFASAKNRIMTVGDPDQSIYGWRSAEIKNLKRMKRQYPDTLVMHLEDNYRSSGTILLAALEVIQQDDARPPKPLLPTHCPGTPPVLRHLPTAAAEADWIVSEIKRSLGLTGHLLKFSDFAILLRSASQSRQIESAMGKAGIPYRMVGGQRFFDRVEVKILLDYLRVISQPDNSDALARILNIPSRRIGETTIKALLDESSERNLTLWKLTRGIVQGQLPSRTKLSKPAERGLCNFINIITGGRSKMSSLEFRSPTQILEYLIEKLNFQQYLKDVYSEDHEGRWANVEELMSQASDCANSATNLAPGNDEEGLPSIEGLHQYTSDGPEESLSKFLANVALSTEIEKRDDGDTGVNERLTISTIHAAKGLEWPVVFIPSTYEGSIPHSRAEDTDEERRLLYVAMTRAQALLYMSCPKKDSLRQDTTLSPFLSTPKVAQYLSNQGPALGYTALMDMANILRREMPSQVAVEQHRSEVQNHEDNLWSLTGEEDEEALESRWNRLSEAKHVTTTFSPVSATLNTFSALQASSTSTYTYPPPPSGFITASSRLQELTAEPKAKKTRPNAVQRKTTISQEISMLKSQDTLSNMWGLQTTHSLPKSDYVGSEEQILRAVTTITAPTERLSSTRSPLPNVHNTTYPATDIPEPLTNRVLQPLTNGTRPRLPQEPPISNSKPYAFLSSSPPQADLVPERINHGAEQVKPKPIEKSSIGVASKTMAATKPLPVSKPVPVDTSNQLPSLLSDRRPLSTRHTTTMAAIQTTNPAPSRTLGVRRSLNGWNAQNRQTPFNPPKRKLPP